MCPWPAPSTNSALPWSQQLPTGRTTRAQGIRQSQPPRAPLPGKPAQFYPTCFSGSCLCSYPPVTGLAHKGWGSYMDGQWKAGWIDTQFVEGLMIAELAGSGTGSSLPGCPQGLLVGNDSQGAQAGRDGSWRCGCPHPGLQAGGESPRTMMHSP